MKDFTNYTIHKQASCLEALKKLDQEKSNKTSGSFNFRTFIKKQDDYRKHIVRNNGHSQTIRH